MGVFFYPTSRVRVCVFTSVFIVRQEVNVQLSGSFFVYVSFFLRPIFFRKNYAVGYVVAFYFRGVVPRFRRRTYGAPSAFSNRASYHVLPVPGARSNVSVLVHRIRPPNVNGPSIGRHSLPIIPIVLSG